MTRFAFPVRPLLVALALAAGAAAAAEAPARDAADTLYARLGGEPVVVRIANATIERAIQDPRTKRSFKDSNLTRVKKHLAQQLCQLADGGCTYEGDPMREVHAGHDITEAEFYALVEILQDVLRAEHVDTGERNALLAKLAPMKPDVVRVAPAGPAPARAPAGS